MIVVEHGWHVTWSVGSANLTAAAFTGSNVEMMASVTGKKGGASGRGIDHFLDRRIPEVVRAVSENRTGRRGPARDRCAATLSKRRGMPS